jgi:hypothetical protein
MENTTIVIYRQGNQWIASHPDGLLESMPYTIKTAQGAKLYLHRMALENRIRREEYEIVEA